VLAQRMYGFGQRHGIEFVYFIDPGGDDDAAALPLPDYIRQQALCYDIAALYDRLSTEHFDHVMHFLSSDIRFTQLIRAALSVPGYVYVGNEGYHDTVALLAERGMISPAQAEVEERAFEMARDAKGFATPTIVASAKGIIAERHVRKRLDKTLQAFAMDIPVLEVPECSVVNFDANALVLQRDIYGQIFAFMEDKHGR
jgi:hypothetical protein